MKEITKFAIKAIINGLFCISMFVVVVYWVLAPVVLYNDSLVYVAISLVLWLLMAYLYFNWWDCELKKLENDKRFKPQN